MKKVIPLLLLLLVFVVLLIVLTLVKQIVWYPKPSIVPEPIMFKWNQKAFVIRECITLWSHQEINEFLDSLKEIYSEVYFRNHPNLKFTDDCKFRIKIEIKDNPSVMMPDDFDPEAEYYKLNIYTYKKGTIIANYQVGIIRAMDTLGQLFQYDEEYLKLNSLPVQVEDQPRYGYRGFMLDISRQFFPIPVLKRIINGLRMTKINVLHLHINDDDSIPIRLPSFPEMAEFTAFTPAEIYEYDEIIELVNFAYERGITVIPEFGMPGNMGALRNYDILKEILTWTEEKEAEVMPDQGIIAGGPPKVVLNPALDITYKFLFTIFQDLLAIFQQTKFFHFGGNIINYSKWWENDPIIQKYMEKHSIISGSELFEHFHFLIHDLSRTISNNKIIHWVTEKNLDTSWNESSILQYSGIMENLTDFMAAYENHTHIISPGDLFRLDNGMGNTFGNHKDKYTTWADIINFEPTEYYGKDQHLLGAEMLMYTDMANSDNIFNIMWPRLAAFSNVFWSPSLNRTGLTWNGIVWDKQVENLSGFHSYIEMTDINIDRISSRYCENNPDKVFKKVNPG